MTATAVSLPAIREQGDLVARPVALLVRRAILLRLGVAILLHFVAPESLFAPDQEAYHFVSARLARYWWGETLVYPGRLLVPGEPVGYYHLVAVLYYLFGEFALIPKLCNAMVGGLTVRLVFDVTQRVTADAATARRAATFVAYFPSLVLWSALNIRDCWVVLLIVLISREALTLRERFTLMGVARVSLAVVALTQFRDYLLFAVTLPMIVSVLAPKGRHIGRNVVIGMLLAAVVIYADQTAGLHRQMRAPDLERLNEMRRWSSTGAASGFAPGVDISTPEKALAFLPIGLTYFLLAPFPWTVANLRQSFTIPEMLFLYTLVPSIFGGLRHLIRHRLGDSLMIMLITAGLTLGYAVGQGNVGTIYRHRAQVLSFYLIFAAVGIEQRKARRAARLAAAVRPGRVAAS